MRLIGLVQRCMHGETYDFLGNLTRNRAAVRAAKVPIGRLFVQWHRVVHGGRDVGRTELPLQNVAIVHQYAVLGKNTGAVFLGPRQHLHTCGRDG